MFSIEDVIRINKEVTKGPGNIVNKSSLDFALSSIKTKPWFDQLAYLLRSILVDHVFEDGNKRTATAIISMYYTEFKIGFDMQKTVDVVTKISSKNIKDIGNIKRIIKNVIR